MVNVINQFNSVLTSHGAHDKAYWEALRKAGAGLEKATQGDLDKLFDTLAQQQPLQVGPLVFVLGGKLKRVPSDNNNMRRFVNQFHFVATNIQNEELDFVHDKFTAFMNQFSVSMIQADYALHAIRVLQAAVNALTRGVSGVLTNLHARLFCLCLTAKRFDPALQFLDLDAGNCFLNVQQSYRVSCENALLYFYYGGMIKLALKDFHGAAYMFESCVCMPAFAASAIMLESLKKLILLNLILGRPQQLPGFRAPPVQRLSQMKCQKYQSIVQIYNEIIENKGNRKTTISRLSRQIERHGTDLEKDKNVGLAIDLYLSAIRNNISKLPEVFSKLQISKVAKYCRIDDENTCIQHELEQFLQRDNITGKIDAREGTVSFQLVERCINAEQSLLDEATNTCTALDELLRQSQTVVEGHPVIVNRQLKKQQQQASC